MKKLHLSEKDKKIAGVCGGLGEYLDIDPTVIRIIFVVSVLFGGVGIIAYLLMWLLIPKKPDTGT